MVLSRCGGRRALPAFSFPPPQRYFSFGIRLVVYHGFRYPLHVSLTLSVHMFYTILKPRK